MVPERVPYSIELLHGRSAIRASTWLVFFFLLLSSEKSANRERSAHGLLQVKNRCTLQTRKMWKACFFFDCANETEQMQLICPAGRCGIFQQHCRYIYSDFQVDVSWCCAMKLLRACIQQEIDNQCKIRLKAEKWNAPLALSYAACRRNSFGSKYKEEERSDPVERRCWIFPMMWTENK